MFTTLPKSYDKFVSWNWEQYKPFADDLVKRPLNASNLTHWMKDWSDLSRMLSETFQRLYVAITVDTTDESAKQRYNSYLEDVYPNAQALDNTLKGRLLDSGLQPQGFEQVLKNLRAEAEVFNTQNLPLLSQELALNSEYDQIVGAQTIQWEGRELTLSQLQPVYQDPDREKRQTAWSMAMQRRLADRQALNALWVKQLELRRGIAANAGLPDYRAYIWKQYHRFDYSPEDCRTFHQAIEQVVVPAARRIYERRKQRLGLETLRPWDLEVNSLGQPALRPFKDVNELVEKCAAIFQKVDPQLGKYFELMRRHNLLDLDNRKGKAPGGYCTAFEVVHLPFIFMNAVGIQDDVQTLLHEGGHSFHVFETAALPYHQQLSVGMEFAEVASTAMELLAAPYLPASQGGFYTESEAARARIEFLENAILFWPYMAVVDAFQHWVYENPAQAALPEECDAHWEALWLRFMPGVDWSGLEQERMTGWQRKLHIYQAPFYYVEYGLASLGAMQVWRNALQDQAGAVAAYRKALALGGTVPIPALYQTAGARFAMDADVLGQAVSLAEATIANLDQ
jgi:oligoendopeptidase F